MAEEDYEGELPDDEEEFDDGVETTGLPVGRTFITSVILGGRRVNIFVSNEHSFY